MRIKKGDTVQIMRGKDRGKTGSVIHVFPEAHTITVEGVNLYKKRTRPKRQGKKGETVLVARPLAASNVMFLCKNCKRPTRVGLRTEGTQKVRWCKKCHASL